MHCVTNFMFHHLYPISRIYIIVANNQKNPYQSCLLFRNKFLVMCIWDQINDLLLLLLFWNEVIKLPELRFFPVIALGECFPWGSRVSDRRLGFLYRRAARWRRARNREPENIRGGPSPNLLPKIWRIPSPWFVGIDN